MSLYKKEKLKHSNYSICVSLNITQPTREQIQRFKESLETTFSQANLTSLVLHKHNKDEEETALDWNKIERCIVKHAIELAPEDNKLHSHSLVAITHRTRVRLDNAFIRDKMKELNSLDYTPFLSVSVKGGSEKAAIINFLEYVEKGEDEPTEK